MTFSPALSILLLSLYFSQGFPAGLLAHVLPAVLREQGVGLEYIGIIKMLALPWVLKFLWAPWIDRRPAPGLAPLGGHRSWILLMMGGNLAVLMALAALPPTSLSASLWLLFLLCLLGLNLMAATQDIATDGLAVRLLPPTLRGWGNALQVGGYKIGMIVSASLLLMSIDTLGWSLSLASMVGLMALLLVPVLVFDERRALHAVDGASGREPSSVGSKDGLTPVDVDAWKRELATRRGLFWWLEHYRQFVARPGMGLWLGVLVLYKVPDGLGSTMIKPMLVDAGLSLSEIGTITLLASLVGVAAVFLGGALYDRWGPYRCLIGFAVLQASAMGALALIACGWASPGVVLALCAWEQAVDSLGNVALFALMMAQCRAGHEGADFTLQACIQVMVAGLAAVLSGWLAARFGYGALYGIAVAGALAIALQVHRYFMKVRTIGATQL